MFIRRPSTFIKYLPADPAHEEANRIIKDPANRVAVLMTAQPDWNYDVLPRNK